MEIFEVSEGPVLFGLSKEHKLVQQRLGTLQPLAGLASSRYAASLDEHRCGSAGVCGSAGGVGNRGVNALLNEIAGEAAARIHRRYPHHRKSFYWYLRLTMNIAEVDDRNQYDARVIQVVVLVCSGRELVLARADAILNTLSGGSDYVACLGINHIAHTDQGLIAVL